MSVRIIIDGGSQLTFIKESLSRRLGLPIVDKHKIAIQSFGKGKRAPARLCNKVLIKLQSQYNDEIIEMLGIEVPEICFDSLKPPSLNDPIIRNFSSKHQLADAPFQEYSVPGIALLVGADNYWKIISGEMYRLSKELTAVNSKLGWTLLGSNLCDETSEFMVNFNLATVLNIQAENDEIDINQFWSLETIGINKNEKINDNFTLNFMNNNIVFNKERYEVLLPWKDDTKLDSNYNGALVRVKNLTSKLLRNEKLCEYDKAIREYLVADCAEPASKETLNERAYYMPHRPVYRDDKDTTKIRVVFDASAHAPGLLSLNEQLFSGENLIPDLLRILLNFRIGSIGLIADIEKAFLQIGIAQQDRDSHRFLWYDKPINENVQSMSILPNLSVYRMKRVTFGVTTSPFILAATLRKHFLDQPEEFSVTKNHLLQSFYVDDLVVSVNTLDEAIRIFNESKLILSRANMNLRKWTSNDNEMNNFFKEPITAKQCKRVLGILWHTSTDELAVNPNFMMNESCGNVPTKRNVLKTIAKIFDPLGILGPFTVRAKILLQNIWKEKLSWDAVLPEDLNIEWFKWYSEIATLPNFQFPRMALRDKMNKVELHIFADSSLKAYGAVAYLRCLKNNECNFLVSKNRVAPMNEKGNKQLTLPKLELTAALCAARLQSYILENLTLNIASITLWSDSKIALYWIRGNAAKREIYVQNRITEIQKISQGLWRYCPSTDNPADLLTRGVSAKLLMESGLWLRGPDWLRLGSQCWPNDEYHDMLDNTVSVLLINPHQERIQNQYISEEPIFPLEKYEKLNKIFRVTAYVQRFVNNAKKIAQKIGGPLTLQELDNAENYWIKLTQRMAFLEETISLLKSKELGSKSSILTLKPFMDNNGIMRLGGRLDEASLPYETRHPIILPKNNFFTKKVIINCHDLTMHSGVNATLALTKKRYWIIQGRQQVKSICGRCLQCKRLKGKSGMEPFAPLPKSRLTIASPFNTTGVDFAGPLFVTIDNKKTKVYVMLLTCAVVRAVHLELVPDLTTESCIRGLRRFISRRAVPAVMYSDNAKTFRRTAQELHELSIHLNNNAVQDLARKYKIEWRFIVERASWWGGFWERMVKTVKEALKNTLKRSSVGYDELQTILTEVEATVNSRPLTYIDDDPTNLLILSPSHFLIGPSIGGLSMNSDGPEIKRNGILKQWKIRESIVNKFWKRWNTDYLQQLRSAHHTEQTKSRTIKQGDVVLLHEQHLPRLHWRMVRVTDVFLGRDGRVRACEVITSNGTKFRRPVQLLYPLEVNH